MLGGDAVAEKEPEIRESPRMENKYIYFGKRI